jgi:uncharacterized protein YidB (DUF937 family)
MDPAALQRLAQQTGMPPAQVADQVAQVLPHIVDQATPDGQLPTETGSSTKGSHSQKGAGAAYNR